LLLIEACGPLTTTSLNCRQTTTGISLSEELEETSGVAISLSQPDVFWSHNDDGSVLSAIDSDGKIISQMRIRPSLRDWEDIAASRCPGGGSCLYLADMGDNLERRPAGGISIRRLEEPDLTSPNFTDNFNGRLPELDSEVFPVRLPDGPRDIEALLVLPEEEIYVITKGRNGPVTVYRYPPPLRHDTITLELVGGSDWYRWPSGTHFRGCCRKTTTDESDALQHGNFLGSLRNIHSGSTGDDSSGEPRVPFGCPSIKNRPER